MRRDEVLGKIAQHRAEIEAFGIKSVSVFGSVARDEARPESDVDILVEISRPFGLFKFLEIQEFLGTILDQRVDLFTPESLREDIRETVTREAIRAP